MRQLSINEIQEYLLALMRELDAFLVKNEVPYYMLGGSALGAVRHEGFIPWDDDIDIGMHRADYERFISIAEPFSEKYKVVNFHNSDICDYCLSRIYIPNTYVDNAANKYNSLDKRLYLDIFPIDNVPDNNNELALYEKRIVKRKKLIAFIDTKDYGGSGVKLCAKKALSAALRPQRNRILARTDSLMKKYSNVKTTRVCSLSSQYSFEKQVMMRDVYGTPKRHRFCDTEFFVPENTDAYLTTLFGADYMQIPCEGKRRKGCDVYLLNEDD